MITCFAVVFDLNLLNVNTVTLTQYTGRGPIQYDMYKTWGIVLLFQTDRSLIILFDIFHLYSQTSFSSLQH